MTKSPFLVFEEAISPLQCNTLIDTYGTPVLDATRYVRNSDDTYGRTEVTGEIIDQVMTEFFTADVIDRIEKHYGLVVAGVERPKICILPETAPAQPPVCYNSVRASNKWLKTLSRDLTGVIFLNTFNNQVPYDAEFEVSGGQIQFPQHKFTLNQNRGTCVIFPSDPHFITVQSGVTLGDDHSIMFHIVAGDSGTGPWMYQPSLFPGDYRSWFQDVTI